MAHTSELCAQQYSPIFFSSATTFYKSASMSNVDSVRKELYWCHTADDGHAAARHCHSCAQNRAHRRKQRQLELLLPDGCPEYACMAILNHLPKTRQGNQFVDAMKDKYTKLSKATPTKKANAVAVTCKYLEYWVASLGVLSVLITENGPQFVSNGFLAVGRMLGVNNITIAEY